MSESPDLSDLLARLAEDRLLAGEGPVLARLLSERLSGAQELPAAGQLGGETRKASEGDLYEPFRQLVTSTLAIGRRLEPERAAADSLLYELASLDQIDRLRLIRTDRRFVTWGVAEGLLREPPPAASEDSGSDSAVAGSPPDPLDRAELALEIAERLPIETYSSQLLADLRASAYSLQSRARGEREDWAGASEAIRRARDLLRAGSGEPSLRGRVFEVAGDVARRCGRSSEASVYYERASNSFVISERHHESARCCWARASLLKETGDLPRTLDLLRLAAERVDPDRDPELAIDIWHDLARELLTDGQIAESRRFLRRIRAEWARQSNQNVIGGDSWRRSWLEARLAAADGSVAEAERLLHQARQGCLAEGRPIASMRISFDLAALLIRADRRSELDRLIDQIVDRSNLLDLGAAATAALTMFLAAYRHGSATPSILVELERYLERVTEIEPVLVTELA